MAKKKQETGRSTLEETPIHVIIKLLLLFAVCFLGVNGPLPSMKLLSLVVLQYPIGDSTIRATDGTGIAATGSVLLGVNNCCNNQTKTKC